MPGGRLGNVLGAICIVVGTGLIITFPFFDAMDRVRLFGTLSAQDLGVLAGFLLFCSGLLLYLDSSLHFLQRRHREPVLRVESLKEAAGQKAAGPAGAQCEATGPSPEAPAEAPPPPMPAPPQVEPTGGERTVHRAPMPAIVFTVVEAPPPAPAGQPSYDYGTAAAPGDTTCRVCGNELVDNACRHCITSAAIQGAYQEFSRTQELGASVEEARALLQSARHALEEKGHIQASGYARSAVHLLQISVQTHLALQAAMEKAEGQRKHLEEEGRDTSELTSLLSSARMAIVNGSYQEAKVLLDKERDAVARLQKPAAPGLPPGPSAAGGESSPVPPAPPVHPEEKEAKAPNAPDEAERP